MTKEYLEQLKQEYLRKKMFASGYDDEERREIFALRNKINVLESSLYPWK